MTGMTTGKETETMSQEYDKMMRQFADKYRVCGKQFNRCKAF